MKIIKRKKQTHCYCDKGIVCKEMFDNKENLKCIFTTTEIKELISQTMQEMEVEREAKQKEQQVLQQTIINAILEADRIKKEGQEKEFKDTVLCGKGKFLSLTCLILAIIFFVTAAFMLLLTILKIAVMDYIQSLSFVLPGMIFLLLRYNVIIMYKSNDIGMKLTVYSITIAVTSLVITLLDVVF